MNKDQLQKELLEKIKPGVKASDLKKKKSGVNIGSIPTPPPPPPLNNKQDNSDEGYESESEKTNKVKELEQALQEANRKIKELQAQEKQWKETIHKSNLLITDKDQTIKYLQELVKSLQNNEEQPTFNCYHCSQTHPLSLLVIEIPEKGKLCQPCWQILRKKTKQKLIPSKFTCHHCQEIKSEKPFKVKLDSSLQEYSICSSCLPLIKEYNEKEADSNRELDIWE